MTFPRHFPSDSSCAHHRMCVTEDREPGGSMAVKCANDWRPPSELAANGQQRITSRPSRSSRERRRRRRRGNLSSTALLGAILMMLAVGVRSIGASYSDTDDLINELDRPMIAAPESHYGSNCVDVCEDCFRSLGSEFQGWSDSTRLLRHGRALEYVLGFFRHKNSRAPQETVTTVAASSRVH
ncbi:ATP-dependent protease [Anopheles sinensis]|uniref:ATP-dependent protease n=1 Tax=Anopheles sinensis TaxID=74873 RepID=A0A084WQS0_ANOSI|nr:ATP-dependent protease [Anopheles sinensis]